MSDISVVIAQHTKAARAAYAKQLLPEKGIHVIAEVRTEQAVVEALKLRPRILVLDWQMVDRSEVLLSLARRDTPGTKVILLIGRVGHRRLVHAFMWRAGLLGTDTRSVLAGHGRPPPGQRGRVGVEGYGPCSGCCIKPLGSPKSLIYNLDVDDEVWKV